MNKERAARFMTPPSIDPDKKLEKYKSLEEMCRDKGIKYTDETK